MSRRLPPLNSLKSFAAAARVGSFTKASESLFVTQGAVSRQVKVLEAWLGKPLFHRTPQGIQLTEAGRRLAASIDAAFAQIEAVADSLKRTTERQLLAINLPPTFATRWLAPRLSEFRKLYPGIDFSIKTDGARSARDLKSFDCAVVFADHVWPNCDFRRLRLERHILVASPSLWVDGLPPRLEDATLLHIFDGETRMPVWETWCAAHALTHVDTQPGLAFSTLDQVINAAVAGAGAAIVDETMVAPELASGTLRRLNRLEIDGPYGYWFASLARDLEKNACVRLFGDWLVDPIEPGQAAAGDA